MPEYSLEVLVNPVSNSRAAEQMGAKDGAAYADAFNNHFSRRQPLGRITGQASEFQKSMEASNARVIAFGASAGSIYLVKSAFDKLISSTVQVEKAMANINVILGLGQTALKNFSAEMFKAASQSGQTFETASQVALEFARHGVSASETAKRMTSAMQLMRISGLDAVDAVNAITAAINAFNKEGISSEDIINRLTAVDTKFAVSAKDLASAIQRVGSTAQDAGIQFNQLLGFVAAAQTATARGGAVIGNAFKSIFTRLARPQVLDDLESIGIATKNSTGQVLPMVTILRNLATQYDHLSYSQKSFITEAVGGVYQVNILKASLADLGNGMSIFDKATLVASQSAGLIEKRMDALNDTIASKLNVSVLNITKLFSDFGQLSFGESSKDGLDTLNESLSNLDSLLQNISPDDSSFLKIGKTLGTGLVKGIGDILSGPGLQTAIALGVRAFSTLGQFTFRAGKEFLGKNTEAEKLKFIQQDILKFVSGNADAQEIVNSRLNVAVRLSKLYAENLVQAKSAAEIINFSTLEAAKKTNIFVSARPVPNLAAGYVPSFYANQEVGQARMLGAPLGVKAKWGQGTIGGQPFIMNNYEIEIPNFGKNGDSAVLPTYSKGFVPNFNDIVSQLKFVHKKETWGRGDDRFSVNIIDAMLNGQKVGWLDHSGGKTKEVEHLTVNPKYQGMGVAGALYSELISKYPGTKIKGTLLPQIGRTLNKVKSGQSISPYTVYPQIKRADIAKSSTFDTWMGMDEQKMDKGSFVSYIGTKLKELSSNPDKLKSFLNAFHSDLITQHAGGFVPNFALDKVFSVLPSRMLKGSIQEQGRGYEIQLKQALPTFGFSNIRDLNDLINSNARADFYARYSGFPWLLDAKNTSYDQSKVSSLSEKENSMRFFHNQLMSNADLVSQIDPTLANDINNMKFGVVLSKTVHPHQIKNYQKAGIGSYEWLKAGGFIPNFTDIHPNEPYDIYDTINKNIVKKGFYKNKKWLEISANKRNQEYGAYKYVVKPHSEIERKSFENMANNPNVSMIVGNKTLKGQDIIQWFEKQEQQRKSKLYSYGFIPNFSALSDAIHREMGAGYSASQIRIGNDSSLISSQNPNGIGIYNSTEGSLGRGIQYAKESGINPKYKGKAAGFIPNFAGEIIPSILMGLTQGSVSDLSKKLNFLSEGYDAEIEARRKLTEEYDKAIMSIEGGLMTQTPLGNFKNINDLKGAYYNKYRDTPNKFLLNDETKNAETTRYESYYQQKQMRQTRLGNLGFTTMFAGPLLGETLSSSVNNLGFVNASKAISQFTQGVTTAGQMLSLMPNKLGKALALGELFESANKAISVWESHVGTFEKQLDIQSTMLEKMSNASNTVLDAYDKLNQIYNDGTSSLQDFLNQQSRLAKAMSDLASIPNGGALIQKITTAGSDEGRRTAVAQAIDSATQQKNITENKVEIAKAQADKLFFGTNPDKFFNNPSGIFSYGNDVDKLSKQQLLRNSALTMEQSTLDQLPRNMGITERLGQAALTNADISTIVGNASKNNVLNLDPNSLKTALDELEYQLQSFKIPDDFKGNLQDWQQQQQRMIEVHQEEIELRNRYNQELQNILSKGAILSNFLFQTSKVSLESQFRGQGTQLFQREQQARLFSLTTNNAGMIPIQSSLESQKLQLQFRQETAENIFSGAQKISESISKVLEEFKNNIKGNKVVTSVDTIGGVSNSALKITQFLSQRQSYFAQNPQALVDISKNPRNFVQNFLGGNASQVMGNANLSTQQYNQLVSKLDVLQSTPDFYQIITGILSTNKDIASKSQQALQQLVTQTSTDLKEETFKELSSALMGSDLLKRGSARTLRREIRRDEYIVEHGRTPLARGEAGAELFNLIPDQFKTTNNPQIKALLSNIQGGFSWADTYALKNSSILGPIFNQASLQDENSNTLSGIQAVAYAQTHGNFKTINSLGAPTIDANNTTNVNTSVIDKAVTDSSSDITNFGAKLNSIGQDLQTFQDAIHNFVTQNENKQSPISLTTAGNDPANQLQQQGFISRNSGVISQIGGTIAAGILQGTVTALVSKIPGGKILSGTVGKLFGRSSGNVISQATKDGEKVVSGQIPKIKIPNEIVKSKISLDKMWNDMSKLSGEDKFQASLKYEDAVNSHNKLVQNFKDSLNPLQKAQQNALKVNTSIKSPTTGQFISSTSNEAKLLEYQKAGLLGGDAISTAAKLARYASPVLKFAGIAGTAIQGGLAANNLRKGRFGDASREGSEAALSLTGVGIPIAIGGEVINSELNTLHNRHQDINVAMNRSSDIDSQTQFFNKYKDKYSNILKENAGNASNYDKIFVENFERITGAHFEKMREQHGWNTDLSKPASQKTTGTTSNQTQQSQNANNDTLKKLSDNSDDLAVAVRNLTNLLQPLSKGIPVDITVTQNSGGIVNLIKSVVNGQTPPAKVTVS